MWNRFSDGQLPENGRRFITFTGSTMVRYQQEDGSVYLSTIEYNKDKDYSGSISNDIWWQYEDNDQNSQSEHK